MHTNDYRLLHLFYTSTYATATYTSSLPGCVDDVSSAERDVDLLVDVAVSGPTVHKRPELTRGGYSIWTNTFNRYWKFEPFVGYPYWMRGASLFL